MGEILLGTIAGVVSSMGMRRRNNINIWTYEFYGIRPTFSTRS